MPKTAATEGGKGRPSVKKRPSRSKIARGRRAKIAVARGTKVKTAGGVTKEGIMKNPRGRLVSRKASAAAKVRFKKGLQHWNQAVSEARKQLRLAGFVAINGGSCMGKALYCKARSLFRARQVAEPS
mmetsp:Transcript_13892/g.39718  ORF Transcript_13892/g.39718 Transcript_13892/m.39718 type:complete len:127 (+) Transcript_13892:122-502(+)